MREPARIRLLPDGRRLYLHDGPIDVILEGFGSIGDLNIAYKAATNRFATILDELCAELSILRQPLRRDSLSPSGAIARRMVQAVRPYADETFITPMAAVAGAIAEEILQVMIDAAPLQRAYVNDGGDIAVHLAPGEQFVVGMIDRPDRPSLFGSATVRSDHPVHGIATSGWRGRSFSLGVADAVTVLADRAASADAAATIIANAVNLPDHPKIRRVPARDLAPDNDLGELAVTVDVGEFTLAEVHAALDSGEIMARKLLSRNLICAAALHGAFSGHVSGGPSNHSCGRRQ